MDFIRLVDVQKSFLLKKKTLSVLKNVNCTISEGDFVVLLGPSGSGKTTLLNLISGIDKPTSGSIFIGEEDIAKLNHKELDFWRRKNVGIVFQNYNLMSYMSALENVALPLMFEGVHKKNRIAKAKSLLRCVGLSDRLDQDANYLSGGEQQRVTIARALINDPPILIADEPTGDLDIANATEIMELIYNFYKEDKRTIIMSTHNANYAKYADKVIYIKNESVDMQKGMK